MQKHYMYGLYVAGSFKPPPPQPIPIRHSINILLVNISQNIPELDGQIKGRLAKEMAACTVEFLDMEEFLEAVLAEMRGLLPQEWQEADA